MCVQVEHVQSRCAGLDEKVMDFEKKLDAKACEVSSLEAVRDDLVRQLESLPWRPRIIPPQSFEESASQEDFDKVL
jgi:hypothetical protein